ncbi:MAG TPA: methyltransferase domain-containing protein, partial [Chloroflexota bacterium]|nr:methyltransferase domain-containing protein [Chloroflexota bacterium]
VAVGADPSGEMIRLAEERAAGRSGVRFVQAGFGELADRVGSDFDVLTCLGNTLPHTLTRHDLDNALADMAAVLRPGGMLVIQMLNYDLILAEQRRFLGVSSGVRGGVEYLFFRFYDFDGLRLTFNVATFKREGEGWSFNVDSTQLRAITQEELADALTQAGYQEPRWYGGLDRSEFDPASSGDLVAVAYKPERHPQP